MECNAFGVVNRIGEQSRSAKGDSSPRQRHAVIAITPMAYRSTRHGHKPSHGTAFRHRVDVNAVSFHRPTTPRYYKYSVGVRFQRPGSRSAPWYSCRIQTRVPQRGSTSLGQMRATTFVEPLRGTAYRLRLKPRVRCATLGCGMQRLRRSESNKATKP